MKVRIRALSYYLPGNIISNDDLRNENPDWDMQAVEKRVGVFKRHIAKKNETALDMAIIACSKLFSEYKDAKKAIDNNKVASGDKVLLCGFGVGLSWGTAIVEL